MRAASAAVCEKEERVRAGGKPVTKKDERQFRRFTFNRSQSAAELFEDVVGYG